MGQGSLESGGANKQQNVHYRTFRVRENRSRERSMRPLAHLSFLLCVLACASTPEAIARAIPASAPEASAPNWKERLEEAYVFVEHRGDYRSIGAAVRELQERALESGVEPSGPAFGLFFDDPGHVPTKDLRSRACFPVRSPPESGTLPYAVLPRSLVVYRRVPGPYPEVPQAYPEIFRFIGNQGWQAAGPVREIYLVDPSAVASVAELWTEVQIPWTLGN